MKNKFFDKSISRLLAFSPTRITVIATFIVVLFSMPLVYILHIVFGEKFTYFSFFISIILPILLTPPIIFIFIRFTKHLKYFKEHLTREIEESKKKDVMLFEQARFVLMGEMMANISHQWKQPLNTINLAVFTAKTSNPNEKDLLKYFDIMEDNVNYLADTIDDFMSFFDKKTHLEIRNLESIVKEVQSIIKVHIANRGIDLEVEVDDKNGDVMIASSISQVVLNVLNNAKDAFDETIKTKKIILKFTTSNEGLIINCCDSGKGIDKDIKDKIFDPYFTTKPKQLGTGIGLYMSKQIVQKVFNGTIDVSANCSIREGCQHKTCFHIVIPYSKNCIIKKIEA